MQGRAKHIRVLLLCITFFLVSHGRGSHTGPARERWGEASFQLADVGALAVCGFRIHPKSNSYNFLPLNIQVDWPYYRQVNPATPKSNQQLNELNNKITNLFFTFLIRFHLITHLDDPQLQFYHTQQANSTSFIKEDKQVRNRTTHIIQIDELKAQVDLMKGGPMH